MKFIVVICILCLIQSCRAQRKLNPVAKHGGPHRGAKGQPTPIGVSLYGPNKFEIETYKLDKFPSSKVSMHFPCKESEVFATNCACHIRCRDRTCDNAKEICYKYGKDPIRCKYMLLRGPIDRQIATLKRLPTKDEELYYDISKYPTNELSLNSSAIYKEYMSTLQSRLQGLNRKNRPILGDFVSTLNGGTGRLV